MRKANEAVTVRQKRPPSMTPQGRENQLVALAVNLAEKQLLDGSASSQVITHYLKLGSTKDQIEKEILIEQKKLITAKTLAIQSGKNVEELYKNAITAMRSYSGNGDTNYDE